MSQQQSGARERDRLIAELRQRIADGEALSPTLNAFTTPRLAILWAHLRALEAARTSNDN